MKFRSLTLYKSFAVVLLLGLTSSLKGQYCVTGNCNNNTYVNSVDPNTIEYDNMVSVFHSTMVRESDGTIKIWGQGTAHNGNSQNNNTAPPQVINSTNYGSGTNALTGTILRFTAASSTNSQQFAVLTTDGLYIWGNSGILIPNVSNQSGGAFRKVSIGTYGVAGVKANGLPNGVNPSDVKMMFGTRDGLAIVTCAGTAWVISSNGSTYGDGVTDSNANDLVWHRVSTAANTPLTNVVAVRGTYRTMMALTASGQIYTWGDGTRLGNNTGASDRNFATLMNLPTGLTPKMIGMTYSSSTANGNSAGRSYYVLGTDGRLFSLGQNALRQLGTGNTNATNNWTQVTASETVNGTAHSLSNNIAWISPQEHDGNGSYPAIAVLTNDGKLWSWGGNNGNMLGGSGNSIDPTFMPGRTTGVYDASKLNDTDKINAVELGGHTTLVIKQCTTKFGYVGHKINGSMANNTTDSGNEAEFNFSDTAELSVCGAVTAPVVKNLKICAGTIANLADAEPASLPSGATGINWWMNATATIPVPNPASVSPGTYYATYAGLTVICPIAMTVSNLTPADPEYSNCVCYEPPTTMGTGPDTKLGITLLKRAGSGSADNWPMARKSGHIALESNTKGFVITRLSTTEIGTLITHPQEGMMVYDTTAKCLKIYEGSSWSCFNQPACP